MTIIDKKAIESITKNLPQLLAEQKRANKLSALRIKIAIETHFSAMYRERADYSRTLGQIMEGI